MMNILVIHGPNLNLLGEREPGIYGSMTLRELDSRLKEVGRTEGLRLRFFQSNHEGELIDSIHSQRKWAHGIVINPAAFTHYSYALRDALSAVNLPAVEVHLSDIKKREKFRRVSVIQPACMRQISGLGWRSYAEGLRWLALRLRKSNGLSGRTRRQS